MLLITTRRLGLLLLILTLRYDHIVPHQVTHPNIIGIIFLLIIDILLRLFLLFCLLDFLDFFVHFVLVEFPVFDVAEEDGEEFYVLFGLLEGDETVLEGLEEHAD